MARAKARDSRAAHDELVAANPIRGPLSGTGSGKTALDVAADWEVGVSFVAEALGCARTAAELSGRPTDVLEQVLAAAGAELVLGLDEAGRGALAGPLVVAAFGWVPGMRLVEVRDSKALSPAEREDIAEKLGELVPWWGLGSASSDEIDRHGVAHALHLAARRAVQDVWQRAGPPPERVWLILDGPSDFYTAREEMPGPGSRLKHGRREKREIQDSGGTCVPTAQPPCASTDDRLRDGARVLAVVGADQFCWSVAAASVMAKVARDAIMCDLDRKHPEYGFAVHKGYGTRRHLAALERLGPCQEHRKSFAPIRIVRLNI